MRFTGDGRQQEIKRKCAAARRRKLHKQRLYVKRSRAMGRDICAFDWFKMGWGSIVEAWAKGKIKGLTKLWVEQKGDNDDY